MPFRYGGSLCLGTSAWLTYCRWYEYVNLGRRSLAYVVCGTILQRNLTSRTPKYDILHRRRSLRPTEWWEGHHAPITLRSVPVCEAIFVHKLFCCVWMTLSDGLYLSECAICNRKLFLIFWAGMCNLPWYTSEASVLMTVVLLNLEVLYPPWYAPRTLYMMFNRVAD